MREEKCGRCDLISGSLTLIQTEKTRQAPIILVGSSFWQGVLDWMRDQILAHDMVSENEMELIQLVDEPNEVIAAISDYYRGRDLAPTPEELARMSYL